MGSYFGTITDKHRILPIYATTIGIFFEESFTKREEGYMNHQWIQTISGSGRITIKGQTFDMNPGQGILIPRHLPHEYYALTKPWTTHWVSFDGAGIEPLLKDLSLTSSQLLNLPRGNNLAEQLETMYTLANDNYNLHYLSISTRLYTFIESIYTINNHHQSKKSSQKMATLQSALDYINQYYMLDISIGEIADASDISPQYLCRLFKDQLKLRPFEYLKQIRISKAKSMLIGSPHLTSKDVAEMVGFHNPSYFGVIFKQLENMTPKEFVKRHRG